MLSPNKRVDVFGPEEGFVSLVLDMYILAGLSAYFLHL